MRVITKGIPIYFGYLRIVITKDFKDAVKRLKLDGIDLDIDDYGAFVHRGKRNDDSPLYTVVVQPDIEPDLVAHEAVHLVNAVFLRVNAQLDRHNDEPQAYLTGWFVREVYKAIKSKN